MMSSPSHSIAVAFLGLVIAGCEGGGALRGDEVVSLHSIRGRAIGPDGAYLDAVNVEVFATAQAGEARIDSTRSAFDGSFTVQTPRVGRHRLSAKHPTGVDESIELEVPAGVGVLAHDFVLRPKNTTKVIGVVGASDRLAFEVGDIARLFPDSVGHDVNRASTGQDGVIEYFPFVGGSRLVARQEHGGRTPWGDPVATIFPESGRFEIEIASDFEGDLVLDFRGREIAQFPHSGGAKTAEVFVDAKAVFDTLGILALAAADATVTFDRIVVFRADARIGASSALDGVEEYFAIDQPTLPMRLVGLPKGRYVVVATSGADSITLSSVNVRGGATETLTLVPTQTAGARVVLAGPAASFADGDALLADAQLRTLDGMPLPCEFERTTDEEPTLRLRGAPPGRHALFVGDGFVVLDLVAGSEIAARLESKPLESTEIRVRLFDAWRWNLPAAVPAQLRVFSGDVLVSDARFDVTFDAEGWVTTALDLPPGRYGFEFEVANYRRVDGEIEAGYISLFPFAR